MWPFDRPDGDIGRKAAAVNKAEQSWQTRLMQMARILPGRSSYHGGPGQVLTGFDPTPKMQHVGTLGTD